MVLSPWIADLDWGEMLVNFRTLSLSAFRGPALVDTLGRMGRVPARRSCRQLSVRN
jgi:hypothetical protein